MAERVCPWWLGYFHLGPIRKIFENPRRILSPLVKRGMKVLEPGCGMGFFTLEAARLAGPEGRVYAVDLQQRMINSLERRVRRARLTDTVEARICPADTMGVSDLDGSIDLVLAFYLVHEVPDAERFFREVREALRPDGRCVVIEPAGHVSEEDFAVTLDAAIKAGFSVAAGPDVHKSHSAVLERK